MERAIRIQCFQNLANYRKPSSFIIKETYPLPPYSTVLGMIHAACGFEEFHPMQLSIQGRNQGTISEVYTRYSFQAGGKYEESRHQICVKDDKDYGIFKGVAHAELVCENHMVIHIVPKEEDFEIVYHSLKYPKKYLSLGRYEDLLDIERVDIVNLRKEETFEAIMDIYVPLASQMKIGRRKTTVYNLTKEYEITKTGMRRWKKEGGRIKVWYFPADTEITNVYVDDFEEQTVVALA